jgi:transposase-like protein
MIVVNIVSLARAIGVHRNTIRNWVKSGRISCQPGPGKGLLFSPEGFACLLEEFRLSPDSLQSKELVRQWEGEPNQALAPSSKPKREEIMFGKTIGSVLVVGGGIAGIQASLDLAESGYYVHLVEKRAGIGGKMAQLDKTYPTNDCAM